MADEAPTIERAPEKAPPAEGKEAPPEAEKAPEAELRAQLEASRRDIDSLVTRLKYLQADFENFRKRAAREAEAVVTVAHEALLSRLLPVLDEFDAAVANLAGDPGEGIRMIRDNLMKALQEMGLQEIPAEGTLFDPYVHECVERVPDAGLGDGVVKAVVRKGYRLRDRVLRPAHVIVVKNEGEPNG